MTENAVVRIAERWKLFSDDCEHHFNPQSDPAAGFREEFQMRENLSASARAILNGQLDVRYGNNPRQLLDIFPSDSPRAPIHIHIHGGFFRMGDKSGQTIVAQTFVNNGISCVLPAYDLCPDFRVGQIILEIIDAIEWVYQNAANIGDKEKIFISGSSVGAMLCAMALNYDWRKRGLPEKLVSGVAFISGIYNLHPVRFTSLNDILNISNDDVEKFSPFYNLPRYSLPAIFAIGGKEPLGWRDQTFSFANVCRNRGCSVQILDIPDATHFGYARLISEPGTTLQESMIAQTRDNI